MHNTLVAYLGDTDGSLVAKSTTALAALPDAGNEDIAADPNWLPLLNTPNHSEYPPPP